MNVRQAGDRPGRNVLLASLPEARRRPLMARGEAIFLRKKDLLYEADGPIRHVYFPQGGVVSLLVIMHDGRTVEVGTVGNEGIVGVPALLGATRSPIRAVTQIAGEALRIDVELFRKEMRRGGPLPDLMHRYVQAVLHQRAQLAACNHLHSVEERMCRWLLSAQDRVGSDEFPLTQEFLAAMLVVRRASVTVVAGLLQRAGLIRYSRGRITILDRRGLEAASCECYHVFKREQDRVFAG